MEKELDCVIYTQDWHPHNHISFVERARDHDRKICGDDQRTELKAFDVVLFEIPPVKQVLYPSHCVQYTWGAELHSGLVMPKNRVFIVKKGRRIYADSYSAFTENGQQDNLENLLRSRGITAVLGCGLAYDICVRQTIYDASKRGFLTAVIRDCSKGFSREMVEDTNKFFAGENIAILSAFETRRIINRKAVPIEWLHKMIKRIVHKCPAA
ncbi:isochorismatase family protein [Oesophagostomum dentatum]|uniref:nicotinamidase n=1 Tax=Oesophagostomum dentatum TaxID=61180 RepID=A0A0B1TGK9_OESDE|nr:isochorismatase family protein [Oesophagostomum dentatum]